MNVRFLPDDVTVEAQPGEPYLQVAERAGVFVPTGCLMGSCHACEIQLDDGTELCACISSLPPGKSELTVNLFADPVW
ncbi:ferredoxin [Rubidibacter lacunae KORDI 51-2]|uniref:Ferredoxin n=1 Tax=Rubidibacter lacunae KORDI 51-2 TaxID=582515 RepID=U5DJ00_9CHRO|nr:2Fe-2S iron-sulfur cluster-binding protein [Rubidibacter lacunae]ERN41651.1 ferredoxin [Rubidibacter lacunae KORDI 51-2]